jgi:hypothetical protein
VPPSGCKPHLPVQHGSLTASCAALYAREGGSACSTSSCESYAKSSSRCCSGLCSTASAQPQWWPLASIGGLPPAACGRHPSGWMDPVKWSASFCSRTMAHVMSCHQLVWQQCGFVSFSVILSVGYAGPSSVFLSVVMHTRQMMQPIAAFLRFLVSGCGCLGCPGLLL